jgi:sodium transport system permease protein
MSALRTVWFKEILENLRDRRTVISTFVFGPLFGPVLIAAFMAFALSQEVKRAEKELELPVIGAEYAPNLITHLKQSGIKIVEAPKDPKLAVRQRQVDVVLQIPETFGKQWQSGERARIELIMDRSQVQAQQTITRVTEALQSYGQTVAAQRLLIRGIDPLLLAPLEIASLDQSTPQSRAGIILAMFPYILILTVFAGASYLAIDTTAGERERQSLEPLLINPVSRAAIMLGKLMATATFALASLVLCIVAFAFTVKLVPTGKLGINIVLGVREGLLLFALTAPIALVGAAVEVMMASYSKTYREAQTYLTLIILVPAMPSLIMAINPIKAQEWMYAVPLLSHQLLIEQTVKGEALNPAHVGLCVIVTLLVAGLFAWAASRLYHREHLAISA